MKYQPIAFLSYVREDDEHENGRISEIKNFLSAEVRMQTGEEFPIFQDREDIHWGESWRERIVDSLNEVTFFIPVVTPSFFKSDACREELEIFLAREKELGLNNLILPIYYVDSYIFNNEQCLQLDELAQVLSGRQYVDWRMLRFDPLSSPVIRKSFAEIAAKICGAINNNVALPQPVMSDHKVLPRTGIGYRAPVAKRILLNDAVTQFLESYFSSSKRSEKTFKSYSLDLKQFRTLIDDGLFVVDIDQNVILAYEKELKTLTGKHATVDRKLRVIKIFLKFCLENKWMNKLPDITINSAKFRPKKPVIQLTVDEILLLRNSARKRASLVPVEEVLDSGNSFLKLRDLAIIEMLLAGVKSGQIETLLVTDFDSEKRQVTLKKGNRKYSLLLKEEDCYQAVDNYYRKRKNIIREGGCLFLNRFNKPISGQMVRKVLNDIASEAGVDKKLTVRMLQNNL